MAEEQELTGWERSRAAQKGYGNFYAGLAIATAIFAGIWIGSRVFTDTASFGMNLWTEGIGILVTVGLFGLISKYLADEWYKQQLVDEAASLSNEVAKHAVHVMRRRGWLEGKGSLLQGVDLTNANLREVNLLMANLSSSNLGSAKLQNALISNAVLESADISHAKLDGARLDYADLQGVRLVSADLQGASLISANLQNSNLLVANLKKADLSCANLENTLMSSTLLHGAVLAGANLKHADLRNAVFDDETIFDSETILPDGSNWTLASEMRQFTDAKHPNFKRVYRNSR